jgi:hypothetical protein
MATTQEPQDCSLDIRQHIIDMLKRRKHSTDSIMKNDKRDGMLLAIYHIRGDKVTLRDTASLQDVVLAPCTLSSFYKGVRSNTAPKYHIEYGLKDAANGILVGGIFPNSK